MGAAKNRKAEIAALKDEKFILVEVMDKEANKHRWMSMPMAYPFMEYPMEKQEAIEVAETKIQEFLDGRDASDLMSKYHFANWAFNYIQAGGQRLIAHIAVVNRKDYTAFNAENS